MTGDAARKTGLWKWIAVTAALAAVIVSVILWIGLRPKAYSQGSPEDVLLSVGAMIKDNQANRISDLFLAKSLEERATLIRLGELFGTLQKLGKVTQERFPKEVAVLRAQLAAQSAGKEQSIINALATGGDGAQRVLAQPRTFDERQARGDQLQDLTMQLLSDPFGWLQENSSRLGVTNIDDETAVVTFDKQPLLGGIAQIKKENGRWWLVLPLQLPGVAQFAPQTRNEWSIIASLMKVVDNALKELSDDIAAGKARSINEVPRLAGEKSFIPTVIVMGMYGKEMDVRQRRERALTQFRKRWNQYLDDAAFDGELRRAVFEATNKAAIEELDSLVRARAADRKGVVLPDIPKLQDGELVSLVEGWLKNRGGELKISTTLTVAQVQKASAAIDAKASSGIRSRPTTIK